MIGTHVIGFTAATVAALAALVVIAIGRHPWTGSILLAFSVVALLAHGTSLLAGSPT
jgi:hypothetical protein